MKKLLIALFNNPHTFTLASWASWNITSEANIDSLPDNDALNLGSNLATDVDDISTEEWENDNAQNFKWYKTYITPINKYLENHYK